MEIIRQQGNIMPVDIENIEVISIFDLGIHASEILAKWEILKKIGKQVSIKEFPTVDFMQTIEDKQLMEIILEFVALTEANKKLVAKQRQAEGIAKARKNGIKLGRKEKKIADNFGEIYEQVLMKKITMKRATEMLDIDYKTYKKWTREYKR